MTIDLVALFAATVLAGGDSRVSSFYNAGDAASIDGDNCVPFDAKYNAVAVNFGTNMKETTSLSVFSSSNCENPAGDDITVELEAGTPQQCISQSAQTFDYHVQAYIALLRPGAITLGAKWGTVQKTL